MGTVSVPEATRDTQRDTARDTVRQLAGQGLSNRAIARRVGVSESTVRRWRKADAPTTQDDAAHDAPDDALTIPLDDDLHEHLAVLAEAGHDPQAAVRLALQLLADAYLGAWDHGDAPRGTPPHIRAHATGAPCASTLDTWSPSTSPPATCPPTRPPSNSASP